MGGGAWGHGASNRWCSADTGRWAARLIAARCRGGWPPVCRGMVVRVGGGSADARCKRGLRGTAHASAEAEPGAAPDTAIGRSCDAHFILAVQVSCSFGHPKPRERPCGGAGRVVRVGDARAPGSAWCSWVSGAARRREWRLGVAGCGWGHGGAGRWRSAWCPWVVGAARRRVWRWAWPPVCRDTAGRVGGAPRGAVGGGRGSPPRGVGGGWPSVGRDTGRGVGDAPQGRTGAAGIHGAAVLGVCPRTAVVREPNPALHLTPPADWGRTAHPVMAVQVSFMFGNHRVQERACGGSGRVVRVGEPRVSGSACGLLVVGAARRREVRVVVARCGWGHGGAGRWCSAWCPWLAGAAHRRGCRWWAATGVPRHGGAGRWWLRGCAARARAPRNRDGGRRSRTRRCT